MTNPIPQAAVDAAKQVLLDEGCLDQEHYPGSHHDRMTTALEAAMPELLARIEQLQADCTIHLMKRHELEARIAAVEKLHYPALMPKPRGGALKVCSHCARQMHAVEKRAVWPCDTVKAARGE